MESTSQHELSLCSGFFNAQYYIEVRSSSNYWVYYIHTKGTHIALSADGYVKPFSFLPLALLHNSTCVRVREKTLTSYFLTKFLLKKISLEEDFFWRGFPHRRFFLSKGFLLKRFLSKGFFSKGFLSKGFLSKGFLSKGFLSKDSSQRDSSRRDYYF